MTRLLFFTAKDCAPCQAMKRAGTLEKFSAATGVPVELVDLDEQEACAKRHKVNAIPTMLLELGEHETRLVGGVSLKGLLAWYETQKGRKLRKKRMP